jgi:hypothetical protein
MIKHYRISWGAWVATVVSLAGYSVCSYFAERSSPLLVGLGLLLAFAGFLGTSLAMILDSDHAEEETALDLSPPPAGRE